jgi:hypothetical protein
VFWQVGQFKSQSFKLRVGSWPMSVRDAGLRSPLNQQRDTQGHQYSPLLLALLEVISYDTVHIRRHPTQFYCTDQGQQTHGRSSLPASLQYAIHKRRYLLLLCSYRVLTLHFNNILQVAPCASAKVPGRGSHLSSFLP